MLLLDRPAAAHQGRAHDVLGSGNADHGVLQLEGVILAPYVMMPDEYGHEVPPAQGILLVQARTFHELLLWSWRGRDVEVVPGVAAGRTIRGKGSRIRQALIADDRLQQVLDVILMLHIRPRLFSVRQ